MVVKTAGRDGVRVHFFLRPRHLWALITKTFSAWSDDNAVQLGAALAYYAAFSITPLLIILLALASLFSHGNGLAHIKSQLAVLVGSEAAGVLVGTIAAVHASNRGFAATLVSALILAVGAFGVFIQLQDSLNQIWKTERKPGHFWRHFLKQRLLSVVMIVGGGLLLLLFLASSAMLSTGAYLLPRATILWQITDGSVYFVIVTLFFASIFKIVPDARINWSDVWVGATLTAILFTAGKFATASYLGRNDIGSAFGPAGSILATLAWVFYSSQILFFGAEFTKVHAEQRRLDGSVQL
jgi:membrane protein